MLLLAGLAADSGNLTPGKAIALPGVEGRFDHFAVDPINGRLFVAALGNGSVEILDTARGKRIAAISGLPRPQGIRFVPKTGRLFVACGGDGSCRVFDADSRKQLRSIDLGGDADNVRYDATADRIYVGYGQGGLAAIDAQKLEKVGDVKLPAHPESFQLQEHGPLIFVNLPGVRSLAMVDRAGLKVVSSTLLTAADENFPMALDEPHHRLFIGCRRPAKLLSFDTRSHQVADSASCCGDTDDLFYDSLGQRVYVSGGEGFVEVFDAAGQRLQRIGRQPTAPGARTSLLAPELGTLFVAVPHRGEQMAEIRAFRVGRSSSAP